MSTPSSQQTSSPTQTEFDDAVQAAVKSYMDSAQRVVKESSNKRPQNGDEAEITSSDDEDYPGFGRIYGRQDDPFTKIDTIVNFGIQYETMDDESDREEWPNPQTSTRDERLLHSWQLLCSIIPDFCRQMLGLAEERKLRKAACQLIHRGIATVRADDTSSLKAWMPSYILINPNDSLTPAIAIRNKLKNDRGFYHPATASLLCPIKYSNTPETYADIKAGKLPLTATMLPRFMFPDNHVYDPTDISKDLLCGHVMFRAAKHIFQGPSAALEEPGSHRGKQGNAAICGITSMSPRMIAYVAIQARFALSSATSWVARDGTFSYVDFYWHIVRLLDDDEDLENLEIIKLFNYHVFGTEDPHGNASPAVAEAEDEYELIKQQRAAKRARISQ